MNVANTRPRFVTLLAILCVSTFVAHRYDLNLLGQAAVVWGCCGAYVGVLALYDRLHPTTQEDTRCE